MSKKADGIQAEITKQIYSIKKSLDKVQELVAKLKKASQ